MGMSLSVWNTIGGQQLSTNTEVYTECHKIFPSRRAPKKPTHIYERDEHEIIYDWMMSRSYLFEQAYAISPLLSMSIVPVHPETRQTWFQSNVVRSVQAGENPTFFEQNTQVSQKGASQETAHVNGFVKPFPRFSSDIGIPDRRFDAIVPICISSNNDIKLALSSLHDDALRSKLHFLLSIFLEDNEAQALALRFHSQGTAHLKIFQKI